MGPRRLGPWATIALVAVILVLAVLLWFAPPGWRLPIR